MKQIFLFCSFLSSFLNWSGDLVKQQDFCLVPDMYHCTTCWWCPSMSRLCQWSVSLSLFSRRHFSTHHIGHCQVCPKKKIFVFFPFGKGWDYYKIVHKVSPLAWSGHFTFEPCLGWNQQCGKKQRLTGPGGDKPTPNPVISSQEGQTPCGTNFISWVRLKPEGPTQFPLRCSRDKVLFFLTILL